MALKLSGVTALLWLTFTSQAFGWSWIESIKNSSKYSVTIQNQSDHGANYIELTSKCGAVLRGDMKQCEFIMAPGTEINKTDGFAIAPSGPGQYIYIKAQGHTSHMLQEQSSYEQVRFDNDDAKKINGGQFRLIITNIDAFKSENNVPKPYIKDGDVYIYLERV